MIYQYNEQAEEYNKGRLERKESAIRKHLGVELENTSFIISPKNLKYIFRTQDKIFNISKIHNLELEIYDLQGNFIISSNKDFDQDSILAIDKNILTQLANIPDHRYVEPEEINGKLYQSSYTYLLDDIYKPLGILHLPYLEDNSQQDKELKEVLARLGIGFLLIFLIGFALAYFISSYCL